MALPFPTDSGKPRTNLRIQSRRFVRGFHHPSQGPQEPGSRPGLRWMPRLANWSGSAPAAAASIAHRPHPAARPQRPRHHRPSHREVPVPGPGRPVRLRIGNGVGTEGGYGMRTGNACGGPPLADFLFRDIPTIPGCTVTSHGRRTGAGQSLACQDGAQLPTRRGWPETELSLCGPMRRSRPSWVGVIWNDAVSLPMQELSHFTYPHRRFLEVLPGGCSQFLGPGADRSSPRNGRFLHAIREFSGPAFPQCRAVPRVRQAWPD